MNLKFNTTTNFIFADTSMDEVNSEERFNVVLSPSFYWVIKKALPVKYARDAIKLAPSIFEDILPAGVFSYFAYKEDDVFFLFAYNDKEILEKLSSKGIKSNNVAKYYFAQSEFNDLEHPLKIDDNFALTLNNGVVIKVPITLVENPQEMEKSKHKYSKHSIELSRINQIADTSKLNKITITLAILLSLFVGEYFIKISSLSQIEQKTTEVFKKYKLQSSKLQNRSILNSLNKKYETQLQLRKAFLAINSLKFTQDEYIEILEYNNNTLSAVIKIDQSKEKKIIKDLKMKHLAPTSKYKKERLFVEIKI